MVQKTIRAAVTFDGVGLHGGQPVRMVVRPAAANAGIAFLRTDIRLGDARLPAHFDLVDDAKLCTRLVNAAGVSVGTIEHLMAAFAGLGINNALVEIDGPEVPILDGSSVAFVKALLEAGIKAQAAPLRVLEVLAPVRFELGDAHAALLPSDGFDMRFEIDFTDAAIGHQSREMRMANGSFVRHLCDSRTFCRQADVDAMQANGLALGGTYENAVVVDGDKVLSPGGLRHSDEAVRHKMLDALGDLFTAGAPIIGHYEGHKAGHGITNMLLHELFANPDAYRLVACDDELSARLPGAGVERDEIPAVA